MLICKKMLIKAECGARFVAMDGLQRAWGLFGKELDTLMGEMNMELVA